MARAKFTPGRYESGTGTRIRGKVTKATKGKLSTLGSLRYGPEGKPKKATVKKTEQYTTKVVVKQGVVRERKVLEFKGSVKTYAQLTLGKHLKDGKFQGEVDFQGKGENFKQSVIALAVQNRAPDWMMRKLDRMDADKLYLLGQVNRHTVEVYFDYGAETDADVDEHDLFWGEKWDDIMFLIEQYERAFGVID